MARLLSPWGFSRPERWSGLPCCPPGDLSNPGIKPRSPELQVDSLPLSHQGSLSSTSNAGDLGSIPGTGRVPGGGNGNPFQHSCLENPMDRGAWQAVIHGVAKSRT